MSTKGNDYPYLRSLLLNLSKEIRLYFKNEDNKKVFHPTTILSLSQNMEKSEICM
jgi:uncharacterized pyridoxamine 5'-phosphate oxidase family protein